MNTNDLAGLPGFTVAVEGASCAITSVWCGDLLSWAMGRAPQGSAWCTVMGNVNAVAVASLADVAVLVLCEGAVLDDDARLRASQQGINIVLTGQSSFQAGVAIAKAAGLYV